MDWRLIVVLLLVQSDCSKRGSNNPCLWRAMHSSENAEDYGRKEVRIIGERESPNYQTLETLLCLIQALFWDATPFHIELSFFQMEWETMEGFLWEGRGHIWREWNYRKWSTNWSDIMFFFIIESYPKLQSNICISGSLLIAVAILVLTSIVLLYLTCSYRKQLEALRDPEQRPLIS